MDGFGGLIAFVALVLGLIALRRIAKLHNAIVRLRQDLDALRADGAPKPSADQAPALLGVAGTPPGSPADAAPPLKPVSRAWNRGYAGPPPADPVPAAEPAAPAAGGGGDVEQALAGRWFVWIGGIAIAIGGLLFVKYAYDSGLISPERQIILGLAAGLLLVLAGEWVQRTSPAGGVPRQNPVPAALSAAGLAVLFGALYAAHALYGLIVPLHAFIGMAAVALGALLLSRRQGPFIAALGLLGSYATPVLIPSTDPSAAAFFPYLLIILAAALLTLRGRRWWWLGNGAIAATLVWSTLWLSGHFAPADLWPIGLTGLLTGLLAVWTQEGRAVLRDEARHPEGAVTPRPARALAVTGLLAGTLILVLLVLRTAHAPVALALLSAGLAMLLLFAWLKRGLSVFAPVALLAMVAALALWRVSAVEAWTLDEFGGWSCNASAVLRPEHVLRWVLGSGVAFTLAGTAGVLGRPGTAAWGALGAGAAVILLGAWDPPAHLLAKQNWVLLAAGAGLFLLLVTLVWSRRPPGDDRGAGLFALGAALLGIIALARLMDGVWLTLAIAGLALAFALLCAFLKPRLMGPVTAGLASFAALRLFLARELWMEGRPLPWGEHWVLYGYGGPALTALLASWLVRRAGHARAAAALEGVSLALGVALASLEIRVLIAGGIRYENPQFLEMAAHILAWGGAAWGLLHRQRLFSSFVSTWGARLLLLAAALATLALSLGALNPVVTGEPVPGGLAFNALLLAYLLPVPLILLLARRFDAIGWAGVRPAAHALAVVLLFAYMTLQTKRVFQGMILVPEPLSLAESYAYSAVWLGFALSLFVLGIALARRSVRLAGLGILALVVVKVFVFDLSNLSGLFRIGSFVGLGLCLVGIGWLYQRFVGGRTL